MYHECDVCNLRTLRQPHPSETSAIASEPKIECDLVWMAHTLSIQSETFHQGQESSLHSTLLNRDLGLARAMLGGERAGAQHCSTRIGPVKRNGGTPPLTSPPVPIRAIRPLLATE